MKKVLCLILTLAMIISITACGSGEKSSNASGKTGSESQAVVSNGATEETSAKEIPLTMWSLYSDPNSSDGDAVAFFKSMEILKKKMPNVKIEHTGTENEAYKVKMKTSAAANDLPDIFYYWGAGMVKPLVDSKLIMPINDYISDYTKENLLNGTLNYFTFDNKLYSLPYNLAVVSLYCNKNLFNKYSLKLPESYDDLLKAVDVFNANNITPLSLGEKDLWPGIMMYGILGIRMAGADELNAALMGEGDYNTKGLLAAAEKLQELSKRNCFGNNYMSMTQDDAVALFTQGKSGMMFMGSWINSNIEAKDSKIAGATTAINFPKISGGSGDINEFHGGSGASFFINSETKYPADAVKVVESITENMSRESFIAGSGSPAWKADFSDVKDNMNPLSLEIADLTAKATKYVYS